MIFDAFLLRALLAGIGVALAAGPLGCFVVWRRMAYFGDATAHAAILGVAFALALSLPVLLGSLIVTLAMAVAVVALARGGQSLDSALGVLSHGALAVGLVAVSFLAGPRIDLQAFLFGDILAVGWSDVWVIWGGALAVLALLAWRWQALLTATLNTDLAVASGLRPGRERLILALALAVVVTVAIKVVGALLIGSMLLIPSATARPLSRTPERMAVLAVAVGCISAVAGLWGSFTFDTPAGPSIVTAAAILFALSLAVPAE